MGKRPLFEVQCADPPDPNASGPMRLSGPTRAWRWGEVAHGGSTWGEVAHGVVV